MDLLKVPCPVCARVLFNPVVGADGRVRCTNCGTRFSLGAPVSGSGVLVESARSDERVCEGGEVLVVSVPPGRPPQSASYGAASLTAYLLFGALAFGALLQVIFVTREFFRYDSMNWERFWFFTSFLALTGSEPLLGLLLLRAVRSLRRMDAAALEIAWHLQALPQPPPPPTGSDLPYILPCMAGGGVMVMANIIATDQLGGNVGGLFFALIAGLLLFLLGLVFSDVRRFCFRMTWLARSISATVHPHLQALQKSGHDLMMGLTISAAVLFSLGLLILLLEASSREMPFLLIFTLVSIGASCSLCLVMYRVVSTVNAWCDAGWLMAQARGVYVHGPSFPLNLFPYAGAAWGILVMIVALGEASRLWRAEDNAALLICVSISLLAVGVGMLLNPLHLVFRLAEGLIPTSPATRPFDSDRPPRSFPGRLGWTALTVATACWLSFLLATVGDHKCGTVWIVVSGPYYFAVWLILFSSQVTCIAESWEAAAHRSGGES
jgi:hypothetical protein